MKLENASVKKLEVGKDYVNWRNKPVFSYNDIEKFQSGGEGVWYDVKTIAKKRVRNEKIHNRNNG